MVREVYLHIYLLLFRIFYTLFSLIPLKNNVVFGTTYGENVQSLIQNMNYEKVENVVVLTQPSSRYMFQDKQGIIVGEMDSKNPIQMIKATYYLATAKVIILDNYFGTLAAMHIRKGVHIIQIWHALGALKKFGLMNENNKNRSLKAKKRFQDVYAKFQEVVIGSDAMIPIFDKAFGETNRTYLRYGIPRTDELIRLAEKDDCIRLRTKLEENYPILKKKKCILYTPTYRDGDIENFQLQLNVEQMQTYLQEEYVLLVKLHPAVKQVENFVESEFACKVRQSENINELLCCVDILITDYSSVPFEFSFFEKPMIFYCYDQSTYNVNPGLIEDYEQVIPGPIVHTTEEMIHVIQENQFDYEHIRDFKQRWLTYCDGNATKRLLRHVEEICTDKHNVMLKSK